MSPPIVEIIFFDSSPLYQVDPASALAGLMDKIKQAKGHIKAYHAPLVEDPKKAVLVIQWETYEDHKAVMEADDYKDVVATLVPSLSKEVEPPMKMVHIPFDKDPSEALEAPTTEFGIADLHDVANRNTLAENLALLAKAPNGMIGGTWGAALEDEKFHVFTAGWKSAEAHLAIMKHIAEEPEKFPGAATIGQLSAINITHAHLVRYI